MVRARYVSSSCFHDEKLGEARQNRAFMAFQSDGCNPKLRSIGFVRIRCTDVTQPLAELMLNSGFICDACL